jgi:hypothetical protein
VFAVLSLAFSLLLCAAAGRLNTAARPNGATAAQRLEYIASLGWEVRGEEQCEEVSLPEDLNGIYGDYLELQRQAGFDLTPDAGQTLISCCYQVSNYPGTSDTVVLDLLVADDTIVGGDLRSTALDGFMTSLQPK